LALAVLGHQVLVKVATGQILYLGLLLLLAQVAAVTLKIQGLIVKAIQVVLGVGLVVQIKVRYQAVLEHLVRDMTAELALKVLAAVELAVVREVLALPKQAPLGQ
jgi:hypothetical protein